MKVGDLIRCDGTECEVVEVIGNYYVARSLARANFYFHGPVDAVRAAREYAERRTRSPLKAVA